MFIFILPGEKLSSLDLRMSSYLVVVDTVSSRVT
jgi:hypothetical protein